MEPSGRTYTGFDEFLNTNKLPECTIVYPKNGTYTSDEHNQTDVELRQSVECGQSRQIIKVGYYY